MNQLNSTDPDWGTKSHLSRLLTMSDRNVTVNVLGHRMETHVRLKIFVVNKSALSGNNRSKSVTLVTRRSFHECLLNLTVRYNRIRDKINLIKGRYARISRLVNLAIRLSDNTKNDRIDAIMLRIGINKVQIHVTSVLDNSLVTGTRQRIVLGLLIARQDTRTLSGNIGLVAMRDRLKSARLVPPTPVNNIATPNNLTSIGHLAKNIRGLAVSVSAITHHIAMIHNDGTLKALNTDVNHMSQLIVNNNLLNTQIANRVRTRTCVTTDNNVTRLMRANRKDHITHHHGIPI